MRPDTLSVSSIRPRESADSDFIVRLAQQAFAEFSSNAVRTTWDMVESGPTWVAERGGAPVGFAVIRIGQRGSAELCAIAVDESVRGRGVGAALLRTVERELMHGGIRELSMHTAVANLAALELFMKHGFQVTQRLPRYYRGVFDAVALQKRLA